MPPRPSRGPGSAAPALEASRARRAAERERVANIFGLLGVIDDGWVTARRPGSDRVQPASPCRARQRSRRARRCAPAPSDPAASIWVRTRRPLEVPASRAKAGGHRGTSRAGAEPRPAPCASAGFQAPRRRVASPPGDPRSALRANVSPRRSTRLGIPPVSRRARAASATPGSRPARALSRRRTSSAPRGGNAMHASAGTPIDLAGQREAATANPPLRAKDCRTTSTLRAGARGNGVDHQQPAGSGRERLRGGGE